MPSGHPDYAAPAGEVLYPRGFVDTTLFFTGSVAGGSYGDLSVGSVPAGYKGDYSLAIHSANGCEVYHLHAMYVNGALFKAYYFEVNIVISGPRYVGLGPGDAYVVRYYNYGDSARTFFAYVKGILYYIGTMPLHPSPDAGEPPGLEPDETLFLVENPWEGKVWRKVKNIPIPKEGWERHHPPLFLPKGVV